MGKVYRGDSQKGNVNYLASTIQQPLVLREQIRNENTWDLSGCQTLERRITPNAGENGEGGKPSHTGSWGTDARQEGTCCHLQTSQPPWRRPPRETQPRAAVHRPHRGRTACFPRWHWRKQGAGGNLRGGHAEHKYVNCDGRTHAVESQAALWRNELDARSALTTCVCVEGVKQNGRYRPLT